MSTSVTASNRRRMSWFPWVAALVTAVVLCVIPAAAQAEALFGFTGASNYNSLSQEKDKQIAKLEAAAGADVRRLVVLWRDVEGSLDANGVPIQQWGYYDRVIANMRAEGIKPILVLMSAPKWADGGFNDCDGAHCPPAAAHLDDWGSFAYDVANRYPDAAAIEIWNEPSLRGQWTTKAGPDPERYAQVFSYGAGAIHFADTQAGRVPTPVLVGSVTYWHQDEPKKRMTIPTFLNRFYAAGGGEQLRPSDGVGLHAYPWITELQTLDRSFAKIMAEIRGVLAEHDPTRKIWVTETGVTTTGPWAVSQRAQAKGILTLTRELPKMPDVASVIIHSSVEAPYDPNYSHEAGYGILKRSDLAPKLAYCALAELAGAPRALTTCAPGVLAELGEDGGGGDGGSGGGGGGGGVAGGGGAGGGDNGSGADDLRKQAKRHCRAKFKAMPWWPYATRKERRAKVQPCVRRYIRRHS